MKQRNFLCGRKSLQFGPIVMCSTHYFIIPQPVLTMAFWWYVVPTFLQLIEEFGITIRFDETSHVCEFNLQLSSRAYLKRVRTYLAHVNNPIMSMYWYVCCRVRAKLRPWLECHMLYLRTFKEYVLRTSYIFPKISAIPANFYPGFNTSRLHHELRIHHFQKVGPGVVEPIRQIIKCHLYSEIFQHFISVIRNISA